MECPPVARATNLDRRGRVPWECLSGICTRHDVTSRLEIPSSSQGVDNPTGRFPSPSVHTIHRT